jgi:HSP20 family protein
MDSCKIDDPYVLTADLPGIDPGSLDVTTDHGTMTVTANRSARSEDSAQWLANERFFGTFRRQVSLGDNVDASRISASYDNGVLTVIIPVAETAKPRRIDVAHGAVLVRSNRRRSTPSSSAEATGNGPPRNSGGPVWPRRRSDVWTACLRVRRRGEFDDHQHRR